MIEQIVTKEDFELFRRLAESRGNLWQQEMAEEALPAIRTPSRE